MTTTGHAAVHAGPVHVGQVVRRVLVTDLKRTQIVMYAGASGDFNPIHTDEPFATTVAGNPTVMAHGMLTMGAAGRVLTDWFGHGNVRRYRARFSAPVWPGDTLTVTATVTGLETVAGEQLADLTLSTVNAAGAEVLTGTATAVVAEPAGAPE